MLPNWVEFEGNLNLGFFMDSMLPQPFIPRAGSHQPVRVGRAKEEGRRVRARAQGEGGTDLCLYKCIVTFVQTRLCARGCIDASALTGLRLCRREWVRADT